MPATLLLSILPVSWRTSDGMALGGKRRCHGAEHLEMNGGRIWVESNPNNDSNFALALPPLSNHAAEVAAPEGRILGPVAETPRHGAAICNAAHRWAPVGRCPGSLIGIETGSMRRAERSQGDVQLALADECSA